MSKTLPTEFPLHDLLMRRWSPRAFSDQPVSAEIVHRLLEAARWSPSSFNEQPWAFFVATKDRPEDYSRLLGCLIEFNQSWARTAPLLIITAAHLTFDRNGQPNLHASHDIGLASAHLTFQATAEGLFVHQMAGIKVDHTRATLKLPAGWEPVTALAIGYLGDPSALPEDIRKREGGERTRKPLSSFAFGGIWGESLAQ